MDTEESEAEAKGLVGRESHAGSTSAPNDVLETEPE